MRHLIMLIKKESDGKGFNIKVKMKYSASKSVPLATLTSHASIDTLTIHNEVDMPIDLKESVKIEKSKASTIDPKKDIEVKENS